MPKAKLPSPPKTPPTNPENVEIVPFAGPGENPAVLAGLLLISATPVHQYPLTLSFRQPRRYPLDFQIHSSVLGQFFNIEICDLLREHLSKVSSVHPLRVIDAAFGSKKVEYSAPYSLRYRHLFRKKRVDEYKLIGLQLEGMNRMGWIWAEDLDRSFEEGQIKASVYIPTKAVPTIHRPRRMEKLSFEDFKKAMVLKRASNMHGGPGVVQFVLQGCDKDKKGDLSPCEVAELEKMLDDIEAGRKDIRLLAVEQKKGSGKARTFDESSDLSELSDHDSICSDSVPFDIR
ncbi:hypothetical protein AOL_s00007g68 [Orbilia oligospora ATCC 24927]|uniref:EF-hand domain-containing protein n=1 Tax=Arthrobotrys oligospora (strain ATCC 24927 / CBS 115.81 / DSM 1491) TaxID=756982 RepID=G1X1A9_ARTOA|nr:hypothetical protein AOL_s00007g68 [Orbilia oligospora ATCC 24927]EGX53119.1 hypothetical protein AOL_s00007g68 [Orbilia oligospora ATCC 24927]